MNRPRISLCMIVKNEAANLEACLRSAREAVDEMIVVDTGSDDGTGDLARRLGATVIDEPWCDDFARARNAGLDRARGEWILVLDADEILEHGGSERLRTVVRSEDGEAVLLQICHEPGPGQGIAVINPVVRLFRNRPEYRFEGRIHEQIAPSICRARPDAGFVVSDIRIRHLGYHPDVVTTRNKIARNLRLLQQELRDNPEQPFHWYNLGVEYVRAGDLPRALPCFRKARHGMSPEVTPWAHLLYKVEARCLYAAGRRDEALALFREGLRLFSGYTDLYYWYGLFLLDAGRWEAGTRLLRKAVELGPASPAFHREEGTGTYLPCFALGIAAERLRVFDAALTWYEAALAHEPRLWPALARIAAILYVTEGKAAVARFLESRVAPADPESARTLTVLLHRRDGRRTAQLPGPTPSAETASKGKLSTTAEADLAAPRLADADEHLMGLMGTAPFDPLITAVRLEISRLRIGEVCRHVL
ncbi:MAG: glycosyltransferase [Kyrpidia sp.]|nr:glycosyltransferase [Kyrpidia sp.]